ncbi:hypothetical protein PPL_05517 [Heterostelium album PN500]|uniref:Ankyrin repeat protein n=1 Tax=Heterostelium pallidum (strain ATCC 26659 / Pp 5 / PN500) TaxID=670386 RepID=D3BAE1_HETP5|nr:hypothetical protein PPL_05517 [Heterostelium album PN500]EFA81528.1 hypothetical protein PPL_05517 [Heterostelium album PN500]|eukprot:XP_020433645.1 hypothetical protein PPL_05517 [Heterostelium album PN500]
MSINNSTNKLFSKVFNNIVVRNEIFNQVYTINMMWSENIPTKVHRYNKLIESPKALIGNDYLDLFIKYLNVHGLDKNKSSLYFRWSVELGNLGILQYLYSLVSERNDEEIIEILKSTHLMGSAILKCNIAMLEWMNQNNDLEIFKCSSNYYEFLPNRPNGLNTMKWLQSNLHLQPNENHIYPAAGSGDLETLIWVLENYKGNPNEPNPELWTEVARTAARNGHVHILKWINEHHRPDDHQLSTLYGIAFNLSTHEHCDTIDWIHKNWPAVNFNHNYDPVTQYASLELIRWLHENLSETNTEPLFTLEAMNNAARFSSLEVVEFLHYNRTEGCDGRAIHHAAINGRKDIVEFLLSKGYESDMFTTTIAETERNLYPEIVTLIREHLSKNKKEQ